MGALALWSASPETPTSRDQARTRFAELETWLGRDETLLLPLHEVEVEQERRGREIMRLLLQDHLDHRGGGDVGPALEVLDDRSNQDRPCVRRQAQKRRHVRHVISIFGRLVALRFAYYAPGSESVHPLDEAAWLPKRVFGYELQRRAVLSAVLGPFDEAIDRVRESTGVVLSKRSIEDLVRDAAVDFEVFYAQRPVPAPEKTGPILVGTADGKGVPMVRPEETLRVVRRGKGKKANKKRIATVAAVFTLKPRIRTPEEVVESLFHEGPRLRDQTPRDPPEHKRVWASVIRDQIDVLEDAAREIAARDPDREKTIVLLVDGDRGLRLGFGEVVPDGIQILDLLHVLEKLWRMAYCFHKEGSDEAKEWVRKRALQVLQGKVSQVVKGIRQSATKRGLTGRDRKFVDRHTKYMIRNKARMRYDEYLQRGLPIASGAVEGACKNLIKDRMERSGMRWTLESAEALLKLRAAYLSGDFDPYWAYHVQREQDRLYPDGRWWVVGE